MEYWIKWLSRTVLFEYSYFELLAYGFLLAGLFGAVFWGSLRTIDENERLRKEIQDLKKKK